MGNVRPEPPPHGQPPGFGIGGGGPRQQRPPQPPRQPTWPRNMAPQQPRNPVQQFRSGGTVDVREYERQAADARARQQRAQDDARRAQERAEQMAVRAYEQQLANYKREVEAQARRAGVQIRWRR